MAGESATNDVDEEVYDNDGAERNEAREASPGDAFADADQAGQLHISGEAKTATSLGTPEPPTNAARKTHNATHVPFRDWCSSCVAESWTEFSAQTSCGEQDGGYVDFVETTPQVTLFRNVPCVSPLLGGPSLRLGIPKEWLSIPSGIG